MSTPIAGLGPLLPPSQVSTAQEAEPGVPDPLRAEEDVLPAVMVEISPEARRLAELRGEDTDGELLLNAALRAEAEESLELEARASGEAEESEEGELRTGSAEEELSEEEREDVARLRERDAEVRAHEAAHQSAGGGLTGGASFSYETGPDGKRYAVGGEVSVQMRKGRTPEETITNAQAIRAAAMAPAEPSAQDRAVAAAASAMENQARQKLAEEAAAELEAQQSGESSEGEATEVDEPTEV